MQTVDFFTPIVDDPYAFGQIAAANAISDIYAMGGKPLTGLNIVAFPIATLDKTILVGDHARRCRQSQRGRGDALGGHSIDDKEPKFGMAVTGVIHPDRIRTNAGARIRRPADPDEADRRRHHDDVYQAGSALARTKSARVTQVMADVEQDGRRNHGPATRCMPAPT